MEKVTLFFCDIYGTFDNGNKFKVDDFQIKRFIENLNKIMLYNQTEKIIFTFVTTEDFKSVKSMDDKIKPYIENSNICVGEHIYYDGITNVNKACDIIAYVKELQKKYIIDSKVYYADDCNLYHYFLEELKKLFDFNYDIESIIPNDNGLYDVNEKLEKTFIKNNISLKTM